MKTLNLLSAIFLLSTVAHASYVIDNFSTGGFISAPGGSVGPSSLANNGVTSGTRNVSATGLGNSSGQVQVTGGTLSTSAFNLPPSAVVSPTITMSYSFDSAIDLSSSLSLSLDTVNGDWNLAVTYNGTTTVDLDFDSAGVLVFNGSDFGSISSSVSTLTLVFTANQTGSIGFNTSGSLNGEGATAVPEPTTFAFLGLSAIGGLGGLVLRRRQVVEVNA